MKLSISNIAWDLADDVNVYEMMKRYGFTGLEIAPTRIFPNQPYDHLYEAKKWYAQLVQKYGFEISSMQSICYGRTENIFADDKEREVLLNYLKKAVDFSDAVNCKNLVFGCPKNRNLPEGKSTETALTFFRELGNYALTKKVVIGMEANPTIYGTNYINNTKEALELIYRVGTNGFKLNLDLGTMIQNKESADLLCGNVKLIHHVHMSEPVLKPLKKRKIHRQVAAILLEEGYNGYVSVEMGKYDLSVLENSMRYVREIFG